MVEINTWPGWECVRQIGAGAFGKVYEIQKTEDGEVHKAALKIITIPQHEADIESVYSEGMDEEEVTEYFKGFVDNVTNEITLMVALKGYTNIVSYEESMIIKHENKIGWDILIRMELLTPFLEWEKNHPMSENDIIKLGCDMCHALELCHKNKIIHRDIKPQNIFVNKNGDFKLGDFGIARVVEKTSSVMSQKGTYTYMAPEVFKGQHYNGTADLYSLGLVLYRCLNKNRTPFLPMGTLNFNDRQRAQEQRMAGDVIPAPINGSEKLKQAVLMPLHYEPSERVQTAAEFRSALETCRTAEKVHQTSYVNHELEEQAEQEAAVFVKRNDDQEVTVAVKTNDDYEATVRVNVNQIIEQTDQERKKGNGKKWVIGGVLALILLGGIIGVSVKKDMPVETFYMDYGSTTVSEPTSIYVAAVENCCDVDQFLEACWDYTGANLSITTYDSVEDLLLSIQSGEYPDVLLAAETGVEMTWEDLGYTAAWGNDKFECWQAEYADDAFELVVYLQDELQR